MKKKQRLSDNEIRCMILAALGELDYDIAKDLEEETAEEPDEVEATWARLVFAARKALEE